MSNYKFAFWENQNFLSLSEVNKNISNILDNELINKKKNPELSKKFFEEIAPIAYLTEQLSAKEVKFTNDEVEHNSFDAIIKFDNCTAQKIECTCAIDGLKDALIDEYMDIYHRYSFNLPIEYTGSKNKREIKEQPRRSLARNRQEHYDEITNLINKAIVKKVSKEKDDYKNAILLVVVDTSGTSVTMLNKYLNEFYAEYEIDHEVFDKIFLISNNPLNYNSLFIEI